MENMIRMKPNTGDECFAVAPAHRHRQRHDDQECIMNLSPPSLIQRMEHARDFELAVRAAYLDLAAHANASAAFRHSLVCHGERSAVQAARIDRALSFAFGETAGDHQAEPHPMADLPTARLPQDAVDLTEREIAMYRDCLWLARQAGNETLARVCEDLLEEEVLFHAMVSRILQRNAVPARRDAMPGPVLSLASAGQAMFNPPVGSEARLHASAA